MDSKSRQIYEKIENFLEERKGRERRDGHDNQDEQASQQSQVAESPANAAQLETERRQKQDRRSSAN